MQLSETDTVLAFPPGSPEASPAQSLNLAVPMQTLLSFWGVRTRSSLFTVCQCFSTGFWKCRYILRALS